MGKLLYTGRAHVEGGRAGGRGESSDRRLAVELGLPAELGGDGDGTNPEQLFAVGYAACFEAAIQTVARRRRREIGPIEIDAEVGLLVLDDRSFALEVALNLSVPGLDDPHEAAAVVREADAICPYSNATRGNIDVDLSIHGHQVSR
jgi:osmotically inducible protein OsmC